MNTLFLFIYKIIYLHLINNKADLNLTPVILYFSYYLTIFHNPYIPYQIFRINHKQLIILKYSPPFITQLLGSQILLKLKNINSSFIIIKETANPILFNKIR